MGLTTITWLVFGFSWSFDEWGAGKGFTYVGFRHLDKVWPDTTMPGLGVLGKRQIMIPHHPPPLPPVPFGAPLAERLNLRRLPDDLRYSVGYGHQEASGKIRYTGRPRGLVSNPSILAPTNGPGHHCCGDHFGRCGGAHSLLGFSDAF